MIWQMIEDWFRGILTDGILSNLSGLFDSVNTEVGEIATQVGTTPAGWNAGIFNMIRSLSENVIVPIAGVIITFVMCYELIQLVIEKNNLHDLDTWIFFKWIFKTFVAVLLVTNTWNIVMGVFDITQSVVNDSAGVIISDTSIDIATVITDIEAKLDAMSVGGLLGLWFQSLFVGLTMKALSICIMLVVYGRMIEIYLVTSIAPIPVASSYLSEDADITGAESAYAAMEAELQDMLDNIESEYPGYDEYRVNADEIEHDPYVLISILSAWHEGVFTLDEVQSTLEMLFEKQYILTVEEEVQVRYRTETRTDSEGKRRRVGTAV